MLNVGLPIYLYLVYHSYVRATHRGIVQLIVTGRLADDDTDK